MRIKRAGSNLEEDSNGGFSYIISSWLIEEGQKPIVMTSHITAFCPTSLIKNIYWCFLWWPSIAFHRHRNIDAFW